MKQPKNDNYDQPPAVTPEYLEALRRRWSARAADVVAKALHDSLDRRAAA
jgi:hypothetical protein